MDIGARLKRLREQQGLTLEQVGAHVGVNKATVQRYESGEIDIKRNVAIKLAEVLHTDPSYIMGWSDISPLPDNVIPMPGFARKPRLGTIACGKPILAVEEAEEFDMVPDFIRCDFTLKCKGDSMINARIFNGDIVYIRAQPEVENGQIAAVRIGDEVTLKKVYYFPDQGRMTLQACNPLYDDLTYTGSELDQIQVEGLAVGFTSIIHKEHI